MKDLFSMLLYDKMCVFDKTYGEFLGRDNVMHVLLHSHSSVVIS